MARMRKPFQGVSNIVRFNWHFFALAVVAMVAVVWASLGLDGNLRLTGFSIIAASARNWVFSGC